MHYCVYQIFLKTKTCKCIIDLKNTTKFISSMENRVRQNLSLVWRTERETKFISSMENRVRQSLSLVWRTE